MASTSAAGQPSQSSKGPKSRYHQNNLKYGTPLPLPLPYQPKSSSFSATTYLQSLIPSFLAPSIDFIPCNGLYDAQKRCVIVENREDMDILFNRGFFGKGTLSRSEPSWRERRLDILKGGESAAAEKIREQRRIARKAFKLERAEAMLKAAKAAEALITSSQAPLTEYPEDDIGGVGEDDLDGGDTISNVGSSIPAGVDLNSLTPQTFLVRPTRPDANRNRGRKAFKRRPPANQPGSINGAVAGTGNPAVTTTITHGADANHDEEDEEERVEEPFDDTMVEEMEALQLSLEEAWFLASAIGVLRIFDPDKVSPAIKHFCRKKLT